MFLIVTRSFPPEVGGMQVLMGGLSESLLNHGPVKVFTFEHKESQIYDNKSAFYSKAFILRYIDKEFYFNELCTFRLELKAYPNFCKQKLFISVELLFKGFKEKYNNKNAEIEKYTKM